MFSQRHNQNCKETIFVAYDVITYRTLYRASNRKFVSLTTMYIVGNKFTVDVVLIHNNVTYAQWCIVH